MPARLFRIDTQNDFECNSIFEGFRLRIQTNRVCGNLVTGCLVARRASRADPPGHTGERCRPPPAPIRCAPAKAPAEQEKPLRQKEPRTCAVSRGPKRSVSECPPLRWTLPSASSGGKSYSFSTLTGKYQLVCSGTSVQSAISGKWAPVFEKTPRQRGHEDQGSMIFRPVVAKSAMLRVASAARAMRAQAEI